MQNLPNKWDGHICDPDWVEPRNIPDRLRKLKVTDECFNDLLNALAISDTLSQAESAIDGIFEQYIFLEDL